MPANFSRPPARRLLKPRDVAVELDVSTDTLDRYIRKNQLQIVRLPSGRRRISREDLDRVIEEWRRAGQ
jgi:excisionase family DNA binding protein